MLAQPLAAFAAPAGAPDADDPVPLAEPVYVMPGAPRDALVRRSGTDSRVMRALQALLI